MRAAIFVDRDGVINAPVTDPVTGEAESPLDPRDVRLLAGAAGALRELQQLGYALVVVSNQPAAAKGKCRLDDLAAVHDAVEGELRRAGVRIDEYRYCYHHPQALDRALAADCECRKPAPGLLTRHSELAGPIALDASWLIGDSDVDVQAGRAAGVRTILVEEPLSAHRRRGRVTPDGRATDLAAAAALVRSISGPSAFGPALEDLRVKIFADGADLAAILELAERPYIGGFTTNPTLLRKAGVTDYVRFGRELLDAVPDRPISFEVLSDELDEMRSQALELASWASNVYVKIPVTTTRRESTLPLVRDLTSSGVQVNVTACMTPAQVETMAVALQGGAPSIVSVFAGRIADSGRDPVPIMREALSILSETPSSELLWASPREVLNIVQAASIGCHIITVLPELLAKLDSLGKDLEQFSLETVEMFYRDATASGLSLSTAAARR